jgi:hypothetical protein
MYLGSKQPCEAFHQNPHSAGCLLRDAITVRVIDTGANARGAISTRRRWAALGAISLVSLLLLLQDTAVSVVLPAVVTISGSR